MSRSVSENYIKKLCEGFKLSDLVKEYTDLVFNPNDSCYWGLSPFVKETSKSFMVNDKTGEFVCFSSGLRGNAVDFISNVEKLTLYDSVKFLSKKYNIPFIETEDLGEIAEFVDKDSLETMYKINASAARFYHEYLFNEKDKAGINYFKNKRKLSDDIIRGFGLGYSPGRGSKLYDYLISKGFKKEDILSTCLVKVDEKGNLRDAFCSRVMFPIFNEHGLVIGFGGRVLDDSKPKYLNSPETLIFDKGANLFGLNIAKHFKNDYFICCEGYMDVISMHSAGFHGAVASLGTALTPRQVDILKNLTDTVYLAYDSDGPGIKAGLRAIEHFKNVDMDVRVINMNPYKDPDEFIKNEGKDAFIERIENAMPGKEFNIRGNFLLSRLEETEEEKRKMLKNTAELLTDLEH